MKGQRRVKANALAKDYFIYDEGCVFLKNKRALNYVILCAFIVVVVSGVVKKYIRFKIENEFNKYPVYIQSDSYDWYKYTTETGMKKLDFPLGVGDGEIIISDKGEKFIGIFYEEGIGSLIEFNCITKEMKTLLSPDDMDNKDLDLEKLCDLQYQPVTENVSILCNGIIYLIDNKNEETSILCKGVLKENRNLNNWNLNIHSYVWLDSENIIYVDESQKIHQYCITENNDIEFLESSAGLYGVSEDGQSIYYGKIERTEHFMFYNIITKIYKKSIYSGKCEKILEIGKNELFCGENGGRILICEKNENTINFFIYSRLIKLFNTKADFTIDYFNIRRIIW